MAEQVERATERQARELVKNVKTLEAVKPEARQVNYRIKGEAGLVLSVHPSGRKTWMVRYQIGSGKTRKQRWHEIGRYDHKTLAQACRDANDVLTKAADGVDPGRVELTTFGALFDAWLTQHAKKKLDTWAEEESKYKLHLKKPLGEMPFAEIERMHVREVRDAVFENAGPIQSNRVVALFNRVANWAVDEDHAKFNPAARLRKVGEERRRERVMSPDEVIRLWDELRTPATISESRSVSV